MPRIRVSLFLVSFYPLHDAQGTLPIGMDGWMNEWMDGYYSECEQHTFSVSQDNQEVDMPLHVAYVPEVQFQDEGPIFGVKGPSSV